MPIVVLILAILVVCLIYILVMLALGMLWYASGWVFGLGAGVLSWWAVLLFGVGDNEITFFLRERQSVLYFFTAGFEVAI